MENLQDQLIHAIQRNDSFRVGELLRQGADPNLPDERGRPPLVLAGLIGGYECASRLASNGADRGVVRGSDKGYTWLLMAICEDMPAGIPLLVRMGADVHACGSRGSLLYAAASLGKWESVLSLLESGADPEHCLDVSCLELLELADELSVSQEVFRKLLERGGFVRGHNRARLRDLADRISQGNRSPLAWAAALEPAPDALVRFADAANTSSGISDRVSGVNHTWRVNVLDGEGFGLYYHSHGGFQEMHTEMTVGLSQIRATWCNDKTEEGETSTELVIGFRTPVQETGDWEQRDGPVSRKTPIREPRMSGIIWFTSQQPAQGARDLLEEAIFGLTPESSQEEPLDKRIRVD